MQFYHLAYLLEDLYGKFDLVLCVNTFHEIFSSYLQDGDNLPNQARVRSVKNKMNDLIRQISKLLSKSGSLIFYDGLDLELKQKLKPVKFKIKTEILAHEFIRFIDEYSLGKLEYEKLSKDAYQMTAGDFLKFISTFKYLNSKLWTIESQETYQSLSLEELRSAIRKTGLVLEYQVVINNDLGLWQEHVQLLNQAEFPQKSVLIVASKQYLYSEFDYFC